MEEKLITVEEKMKIHGNLERKSLITFYDIPPTVFIPLAIPIVVSGFVWDNVPVQLVGAMAILLTFGIMLGEIGEKLPIWNKYLGGGATFCLITMCILSGANMLPETFSQNISGFMSEYNFLTLFVSVIIVGSIIGIDRKEIFKSLGLYIPAIIACIIGSSVFGIVVGFLLGIKPLEVMTSYVFPNARRRDCSRSDSYVSNLFSNNRK